MQCFWYIIPVSFSFIFSFSNLSPFFFCSLLLRNRITHVCIRFNYDLGIISCWSGVKYIVNLFLYTMRTYKLWGRYYSTDKRVLVVCCLMNSCCPGWILLIRFGAESTIRLVLFLWDATFFITMEVSFEILKSTVTVNSISRNLWKMLKVE